MLKKIIKYIIIIGLLGVVAFFSIKLIFPAPNKLLVFENTQTLTSSQDLKDFFQTNNDFAELYQQTLNQEQLFDESAENKLFTLKTTNTLLAAQLFSLEYLLDELVFAQNSTIYNSNAINIKKVFAKIQQEQEKIKSYCLNFVLPVLNSSAPSTQSVLNSIIINLNSYFVQLTSLLSDYFIATNNIFSDLTNTYSVNNYSKFIFKLATNWQQTQVQFLNNAKDIESFAKFNQSTLNMFSFMQNRLTKTQANQFVQNRVEITEFLNTVSTANTHELLKALTTKPDISAYINQLEKNEQTQLLYNFLMEGV